MLNVDKTIFYNDLFTKNDNSRTLNISVIIDIDTNDLSKYINELY